MDLRRELADTLVFRKVLCNTLRMGDHAQRALPYSTLLPWMETLGMITGLKQITRLYGLRYRAGNAFNQSSE